MTRRPHGGEFIGGARGDFQTATALAPLKIWRALRG
jgi:hypothetical protein